MLSKCDYLLLDHMLVRHEYVSKPMSQLRLQNQKGTVGFTILPLKLSAIFFTNGVIITVIGKPIASVVKNMPDHISKKL
jgi:hypothetical protein